MKIPPDGCTSAGGMNASVSQAVDLGGGSEEIKRSGILDNCGNNTI
jgi:hypothetical protein